MRLAGCAGDPRDMDRRLLSALTIVIVAPALAWLLWISRAGEGASDAQNVWWFVTVAAGALLAGVVAPRGQRAWQALWITATAAAVVTLYLWWSAYDITGLFLVGIFFALPFLVAGSMALVALGQLVPGQRGTTTAAHGRG